MTTDAGSPGRETRFVSWDELQRVADEAGDVAAIVERELEGIADQRPFEPVLQEFPPPRRRRGRLLVLVITLIATAGLVAIVVSQLAGDQVGPAARPPASPSASLVPTQGPSGLRDPDPPDTVIWAELSFSAPSWVQASADGRTVFVGTLAEGTRTIRARRTLNLTLGNAGGVQLVVNGRPIQTGSPGEVLHLSFALKGGRIIEI